MGIKRLGRKRLAAIEKLGILKDIGISPVMKNALVSATQHREGQKITTDIVLDLGAAAAGLKTHSIAVDDPIGDVASGDNDSYICKVDQSVFGTGKFYKEKQEEKKENIYSDIDEMLGGTLKDKES